MMSMGQTMISLTIVVAAAAAAMMPFLKGSENISETREDLQKRNTSNKNKKETEYQICTSDGAKKLRTCWLPLPNSSVPKDGEQKIIKKSVRSYYPLKSASFNDIPNDLLLDIMSRLPVKSIVRLRCVCKQWCFLTYDAHFTGQHSNRALKRPHIILVPFKISGFRNKLPLYEFEFGSTEDDRIKEYCSPIEVEHSIIYAVSNPVNGLVVIFRHVSSTCHNYLLNPATRELAKLPQAKSTTFSINHCEIGFCFDVTTGEYKLVKIDQRESTNRFTCEVLTIGSQKWRYVGELPCRIWFAEAPFLNGTLYWRANISHDPYHVIGALAFDIKEEKFRVLPIPVHFPTNLNRVHFCLFKSGGQIFIAEASSSPNKHLLRIWMLKDGENPEWKLEYDVDMSCHSDQIGFTVIRIINIKDGKILIQQRRSIVSYDLQRRVLQEIYLPDECDDLLYVEESFISPKNLLNDLPFPRN